MARVRGERRARCKAHAAQVILTTPVITSCSQQETERLRNACYRLPIDLAGGRGRWRRRRAASDVTKAYMRPSAALDGL
jgi:hypothetical protein